MLCSHRNSASLAASSPLQAQLLHQKKLNIFTCELLIVLTAEQKTINYHYVCYETQRDAENNPNGFMFLAQQERQSFLMKISLTLLFKSGACCRWGYTHVAVCLRCTGTSLSEILRCNPAAAGGWWNCCFVGRVTVKLMKGWESLCAFITRPLFSLKRKNCVGQQKVMKSVQLRDTLASASDNNGNNEGD